MDPTLTPAHRLSAGRSIAYAAGNFAVGAVPAPVGALLIYFWTGEDTGKSAVFAGVFAFALVQLFGRLQDAVADPVVGFLSDRWNTRFGRRMPWIALGTPLMLGSFVMLWYPPVSDAGVANLVHLALGMTGFWWGFTMIFAPYLSLLPELETDPARRIRLSQLMAYFEWAGTLFGLIAVGQIIDGSNATLFAALPEEGRPGWGAFHAHGYHVMAWWVAGLGLVSLLPVLLFVRETPAAPSKEVPFKFAEAARICIRNPAFRVWVIADGVFKFGFWLVVASIVFLSKSVLHQTEALAGILAGIPVLLSAALFAPTDLAAQRFGKKRVFQWALAGFALGLPLLATVRFAPFFGELLGPGLAEALGARAGGDPSSLLRTTHAVVIFVLISPSIAVLYVLPRAMLADIADADHAETGYRREAMFNGMWAVVEKTAIGLSGLALAALAPLDGGGRAALDLASGPSIGPNAVTAVGPVGGVCVALAWWVFRRYPIER